jgi:hypothetical protein
MQKLNLIVLVCLILSTNTFGQGKNEKSQEGWLILSEDNYSIQYPKEWELNKEGQMGTKFIVFSPLGSDQDQFRENVNLIIQDLTGMGIDLSKYVEISEGQIKTMITDGKLIESKRERDGKSEFHKTIFTGRQGIYSLKFEQLYWVENEKAYVLTLTTDVNEFVNFKEIGESILKSFILK